MNTYPSNPSWTQNTQPTQTIEISVVNTFLQRVFLVMAAGLAITGLTAWFFFNLIFDVSTGTVLLRESYAFLVMGPMRWIIMLAPLAFVLVLSFGINRLSYISATLLFALYAVSMGVSLSFIFAIYTMGSIATTFFVAGATFGAMALIGMTTKRDLSKMGSILMMALIGIVIASIVNIFLGNTMLDLVISAIGVLVFTGLTAYDTQKIMRASLTMDATSEQAKKASVMGALMLYLDFVNLFLMLLRLMGNRRN